MIFLEMPIAFADSMRIRIADMPNQILKVGRPKLVNKRGAYVTVRPRDRRIRPKSFTVARGTVAEIRAAIEKELGNQRQNVSAA